MVRVEIGDKRVGLYGSCRFSPDTGKAGLLPGGLEVPLLIGYVTRPDVLLPGQVQLPRARRSRGK